MPAHEPVETKNLDTYGDPPLPWSRARDVLDAVDPGETLTWFLGTIRKDGRPHAAGVGAMWHDGELYFVSGPDTQKSRDLAANPASTVSVRLDGIDLVFEGQATRVTDPATLETLAAKYRKGGWPAEVEGELQPGAGTLKWLLPPKLLRRLSGRKGRAGSGRKAEAMA